MVVVANNAVFDGFHIGVADDDYLSSIETAIYATLLVYDVGVVANLVTSANEGVFVFVFG